MWHPLCSCSPRPPRNMYTEHVQVYIILQGRVVLNGSLVSLFCTAGGNSQYGLWVYWMAVADGVSRAVERDETHTHTRTHTQARTHARSRHARPYVNNALLTQITLPTLLQQKREKEEEADGANVLWTTLVS